MRFCTVISMTKSKGFDPIAMSQKTESIVVRGNQRKYVQLGRPLRFYGGTTRLRSGLQPTLQVLL